MRSSEKLGVIIGRFQPFHLGHAWLLKQALKRFKEIIILVGSPNIKNDDNPWDLELRIKMIEKFLTAENIEKKVLKIDSIEDVPDDNEWLEIALKKIGTKNFTIVGDNEWVNGIFENTGYKVFRPGYFERNKYEGVKIRNLFRQDLVWKDRVPSSIARIIKQ